MKLDSNGYAPSIMGCDDTDKEIWLPVRGFEGKYEVSNRGRVRSLPREVTSGSKVIHVPGKIMSGHVNHDGYIRYELRDGKHGIKRFGHVIVMNAFKPFNGNDENMEINHINLDKADNHLENLEWVTHSENMIHARDNGALHNRRTRNKKVLVEPDGIVFDKTSDVAKYLGVKVSTIYSGCHRKHKVKGKIVRYTE